MIHASFYHLKTAHQKLVGRMEDYRKEKRPKKILGIRFR